MKTITLSNDFHHTYASVRPVAITDGRFAGMYKISRNTALRLRSKLCGSPGCTCGGNFGERGGIILDVVNEDYDRNYIVDLSRNNARDSLSKEKSNPAPLKGTTRPKRVSEETGIAPTKRLVARRKNNTHAGYFPNPIEHDFPYFIKVSTDRKTWHTVARVNNLKDAKEFAMHYGKKNPHLSIAVMDN